MRKELREVRAKMFELVDHFDMLKEQIQDAANAVITLDDAVVREVLLIPLNVNNTLQAWNTAVESPPDLPAIPPIPDVSDFGMIATEYRVPELGDVYVAVIGGLVLIAGQSPADTNVNAGRRWIVERDTGATSPVPPPPPGERVVEYRYPENGELFWSSGAQRLRRDSWACTLREEPDKGRRWILSE